MLDGAMIDSGELAANKYGRSTADAVLAYKRKRNIVNRSYQTQADDIVGKMTIAALDREMLEQERQVPVCQLYGACPLDVGRPPAVRLGFGVFASAASGAAGASSATSDAQLMQSALQDSRLSLRSAISTLSVLQGKLMMGNEILTDAEKKAFEAVVVWLKIEPPLVSPEGKRKVASHIGTAIALMNRNLAVKTSAGEIR
jgi:hypothetical protein